MLGLQPYMYKIYWDNFKFTVRIMEKGLIINKQHHTSFTFLQQHQQRENAVRLRTIPAEISTRRSSTTRSLKTSKIATTYSLNFTSQNFSLQEQSKAYLHHIIVTTKLLQCNLWLQWKECSKLKHKLNSMVSKE